MPGGCAGASGHAVRCCLCRAIFTLRAAATRTVGAARLFAACLRSGWDCRNDVCRALWLFLLRALSFFCAVLCRRLLRRFLRGLLHRARLVDAVILQNKVERPRLYIGARDDDGHGVTEAVARACAFADHRVLFLDVAVVVVHHRRDVHEPLDAVVELDEDAECGHAADDAFVGLADELRHVLDFLHIRGLALRLDRDALTRRGVLRRLRQDGAQLLTPLRRDMPRGERLAQETVYHEIGIAADGRGEMRVVARRKTEMPEALRTVACLLHGAQGNRPDDTFLGFPLDLIEHALNVARADLAVLVDVQA